MCSTVTTVTGTLLQRVGQVGTGLKLRAGTESKIHVPLAHPHLDA